MNIRDRIMYFSTGDGANASGEAYAAPVNKLRRILPAGTTTLDLMFDNENGSLDTVRLTIASNTHKTVINSINDKIIGAARTGSIITICDADNSLFVNSNITDCVIYADPIISYSKISGSTQVKLVDLGALVKPITSISLANIHASDSVSVEVFLANSSDNWYILKNVVIPFAATLTLDRNEINYTSSLFNLYIKLSASDSAVDVIIKS